MGFAVSSLTCPSSRCAAAVAPGSRRPSRSLPPFVPAAQHARGPQQLVWGSNTGRASWVAEGRLVCAASASSSEDTPQPEQPLAGDLPVLEVENQTERALAYAALSVLLGGGGLALAVAPGRAVQFLWGACPSLLVAGLARIFGASLLLAAVCANCLKEAAEKDLLRSDTYKRLNLGLMWWAAATGVSLWLAPQQPLRYALGTCTALLAATSAHAALTYHETSESGQGFNPLFLARQFLSSLGNLTSYKNGPDTAVYALYAAKAAMAATLAIFFHGQLKLQQDGLLLAPLGALGSTFMPINGAGYALGAIVLFTLKDAAARGRLGASTFKALNIGVAIMAIALTLTMYGWMQAGVLAHSKLAVAKLGASALLAGVALYNYAFAKKRKGH